MLHLFVENTVLLDHPTLLEFLLVLEWLRTFHVLLEHMQLQHHQVFRGKLRLHEFIGKCFSVKCVSFDFTGLVPNELLGHLALLHYESHVPVLQLHPGCHLLVCLLLLDHARVSTRVRQILSPLRLFLHVHEVIRSHRSHHRVEPVRVDI